VQNGHFYHTDNFEDGMIKAIALGGDTDTVGAVYGQLAGAYYGYSNIPQRWKDGLLAHDKIVELTNKLMNKLLEPDAQAEINLLFSQVKQY
jgi:ADP-ribosyl-[dinitrogen reductase] hydrolase